MNDGQFIDLYSNLDVMDLQFHEPLKEDQGAVLAFDPVTKRGIYTEGYRNKEQKERARENAMRAIRNYDRTLGRTGKALLTEAQYASKMGLITT